MSLSEIEEEKMRNLLDQFESYEQYLDSFITEKDNKFL